jgi:hypothetical protein
MAGGEEVVIGIERASAGRVWAEETETDGADSRGMLETAAGPDVGVDNGMREAEDGESSVIVPMMEKMIASGAGVA